MVILFLIFSHPSSLSLFPFPSRRRFLLVEETTTVPPRLPPVTQWRSQPTPPSSAERPAGSPTTLTWGSSTAGNPVSRMDTRGGTSFSSQVKMLAPGREYYYRAFQSDEESGRRYGKTRSFTTAESPCPEGGVDLGLSVYWAECNIGADYYFRIGGIYAWGETETKDKEGTGTGRRCCSSHPWQRLENADKGRG